MSWGTWNRVDEFVGETLLDSDPVLEDALQATADAGLPPIAVSPAQGRFLQLLARIHGARSILELGTLGGYSTILLARALPPGGRLVTLELNGDYAQVARANIERAGLGECVELRVGPAEDGLRALIAEGAGPFDLVFIDADKAGTPAYFELALKLVGPGAVILVDNVVRDGALVDPDTDEPGALGMRRFHELAGRQHGVQATTIQTVGVKGYDGFTLVLVDGA
ncbi:MAG TPA: O-methyltransferase [Solirubrobacteraceae bacterium]|nr:O-methyltransferase [Solirubrobacteraceae bacterium]